LARSPLWLRSSPRMAPAYAVGDALRGHDPFSLCHGDAHPASRTDLGINPRMAVLALAFATLCCNESRTPTSPTPAVATSASVRIVFLGATARRADLPASALACVNGVGATHTHPSWRAFAAIPLQPVPPDRYEISFADVPIGTRVSFRVNDQNACDENPTGAVTRNVLVNDIRLVQNATTPGNGDEPGFAFTIAANGTVSQ
jgi:hypothetical protein